MGAVCGISWRGGWACALFGGMQGSLCYHLCLQLQQISNWISVTTMTGNMLSRRGSCLAAEAVRRHGLRDGWRGVRVKREKPCEASGKHGNGNASACT